MSPFADLPASAAWEHAGSRRGFEVAVFAARLEGTTTAVESSEVWTVEYAITLDAQWRTVSARITGRSAAGAREAFLESDGRGRWHVDGDHLAALDGCFDVDLESSALTNAFPVHRLGLQIGEEADAPAAYVRALDLRVERLEQQYKRLPDVDGRQRYGYRAASFDFEFELVYD